MPSFKLVLMLLLETVAVVYSQLEPGDTCTVNSAPGVCKKVDDCPSVYEGLLSGKSPSSICGFQHYIPVVCCPDNPRPVVASVTPLPPLPPITPAPRRQVPTGGPVGSMARAKCAEYAESVYQLRYADTFLPTRELVNVSVCAVTQQKQIVGGEDAAPMEFPHMAAIGYNSANGETVWNCGGSLVSDKFVLTAAHCVYSQDYGSASKIRVGDLNLFLTNDDAMPQERNVIKRIKHPGYKRPREYNDIALLKMDEPVVFDAYVRPACLPYSSPDVFIPRDLAIASGWGSQNYSEDGSAKLLKVTLPLVDHDSCNMTYMSGGYEVAVLEGILPQSQLCAGQPGRDTCHGDSGGPLQVFNQDVECMYTVIGVTSLGKYCGGPVPGVYTRVNHYIKWLEDTIWPDGI